VPIKTPLEDDAIALLLRAGYVRIEPPVLQPADIFLEVSGEDIRRRMFVTQSADGQELCLRPEYTIPVCRQHLRMGGASFAAYCYGGPVFRMRSGETGEFAQVGLESIGRPDTAAVDAEIIRLTLDMLDQLGIKQPHITLGDMGLAAHFVQALHLEPHLKRRVLRAMSTGQGLEAFTHPMLEGGDNHAGLLAALEGQDPAAAKAFVQDVLSIAGISTVGGRSVSDIATRFLSRAATRTAPLATATHALLERFLAIQGQPDAVLSAIKTLACENKLDIDAAIHQLETRFTRMAALNIPAANLTFTTAFVRNFDYYTGMIFEIFGQDQTRGKAIAGGGRYDGLFTRLGAAEPVAAVGASIWLDRLENAA
jgi:ATP phosphoribosyltransferase regulatory subunit